MIPILKLDVPTDRQRVETLLANLRLDPVQLALSKGKLAEASASVTASMADVAARGTNALVESARKFDDPDFSATQLKVSTYDMREAAERITPQQRDALKRSIAQVREYQTHIMPQPPVPLRRPGVELG